MKLLASIAGALIVALQGINLAQTGKIEEVSEGIDKTETKLGHDILALEKAMDTKFENGQKQLAHNQAEILDELKKLSNPSPHPSPTPTQ